jgi:hypothetical protein
VNDTTRGRVSPAVRVCDAVCCAIRKSRAGESPYPMLGLGALYELHAREDPAMLMKFLFLRLQHCSSKITLLSTDCTFTDSRSKRAQPSWITHTRTKYAAKFNMAAQVTEKSFTIQKINELNKVIKHLKMYPSKFLKFQKLDKARLKLKVYGDLSFANNDDFTSQLGCIILLTDKTDRINIIHYSSHKADELQGLYSVAKCMHLRTRLILHLLLNMTCK